MKKNGNKRNIWLEFAIDSKNQLCQTNEKYKINAKIIIKSISILPCWKKRMVIEIESIIIIDPNTFSKKLSQDTHFLILDY